MTIHQYISKLERTIQQIHSRHDQAFRKAALISLTETTVRIFDQGRTAQGRGIGQYSTSPILVGAKSFKTKGAAAKIFGSKAKRKSQQWVTVTRGQKRHSLVLLKGGYKQVRALEGLPTTYVDLRFTGRLQSDFRSSLTPQGKAYVAGFKYKRNSEISANLEKKYGAPIFSASTREHDIFKKEYEKAMTQS